MKYLLMTLLLSGCNPTDQYGMSNEEIIKQAKLCTDAGMSYKEIINGFTYKTRLIVCTEKLTPKQP